MIESRQVIGLLRPIKRALFFPPRRLVALFSPTPDHAGHYENLHISANLTSIPDPYLGKMAAFVDFAKQYIIKEYPPSFIGQMDASVYWGTAGMGVVCLRMYRLTEEIRWLSLAREYIDVALSRYPSYMYTGTDISFLVGRSGIIAVGAVVYDLLGNSTQVEALVDELNWMFDQTKAGDYFDWERGLSGLLLAGDYVNHHFGGEIIPAEKIARVLHLIHAAGMKYVDPTTGALRFEYRRGHYWTGFGAHGSASPVYTLLKHNDLLTGAILEHAKATVEYYLSIQTSEGQIPGDLLPDRTQWCHGIPGVLAPLGEAYRVFGDERFREAGVRGCRLIAEIGILTKGMMLCHGVAGNVYMMLDFYRNTGECAVLANAISMILTSLDLPPLSSLDPTEWHSWDSLPEALFGSSPIGALLLYSDILHNRDDLSRVQMPGYSVSL